MSRAERRLWSQAQTLHELGELGAQWLEGRLASQPGYMPGCGPDPDTASMIPTLARINRASFFTASSQPGNADEIGYDGAVWCQRAAVSGWLSPARVSYLEAFARRRGLLVTTSRVLTRRFGRLSRNALPVTERNGRVHTAFGGQRRRSEVRFSYDLLGERGLDTVLASVSVAVADPRYVDRDLLCRVLDEWAAHEM